MSLKQCDVWALTLLQFVSPCFELELCVKDLFKEFIQLSHGSCNDTILNAAQWTAAV